MPEPIRVLELRSVVSSGGGPEKTILLGSARADRSRYQITVCYLRDRRDRGFDLHERARALGVDYVEVEEAHSFDPGIWRRLRDVVRAGRYDIVHGHEYKSNLLTLALAAAEGVIPLSTAHGWTGNSRREQLYYFADRRLLRHFPRCIAVSSQIREELLTVGGRPERVMVVLNGIDHRRFQRDSAREPAQRAALGLAGGELAIASVGRLAPQKRFDLLIRAFASIAGRFPTARLFIVGEGDSRGELEAEIARAGVQGRATLLGHRTDVADLHHAFDLYVQSSDYEGTPNTVLEAMALHTPVVATRAGGTAELLPDPEAGWLVDVGDTEALAARMAEALAAPEERRARAARARRRVETVLSFDARMRAIEDVYDELVRAYPPGRRGVRTLRR